MCGSAVAWFLILFAGLCCFCLCSPSPLLCLVMVVQAGESNSVDQRILEYTLWQKSGKRKSDTHAPRDTHSGRGSSSSSSSPMAQCDCPC